MAAENVYTPCAAPRRGRRFNEAAANGRGKRGVASTRRASARMASMRPRRMAAENTGNPPFGGLAASSFNEAAANGRGKRSAPPAAR